MTFFLPLLKKVEQLSQPILINAVVLTFLILFNIPLERRHKSDLDPKSQRSNLLNETLFSLSKSNSKVTGATFWNKLKGDKDNIFVGLKLNFQLWKIKFHPSTISSLHYYLGFSFTVWVRHILCYQNKSVQPFTRLCIQNIDLCLVKCACLLLLFRFSNAPVLWSVFTNRVGS